MDSPDHSHPKFSILFPARNEEQRIGHTLNHYWEYLKSHTETTFEMIVIANNCFDQTVEIVRELSKKIPNLWVIENSEPGKGRAILEGMRKCRGEVVIFCDSDGSTDAPDVLNLLNRVDQGKCDCAIGSRWLPESKVPIPQPLKRRIASRLFNLAVRIILGMNYRDTQCGAKAFNQRAIAVILEKVTAIGYQFDCDVLWQLKKAGIRTEEIPITWRDSGGSGIQVGRDGLKMFTSLLRIRFKS